MQPGPRLFKSGMGRLMAGGFLLMLILLLVLAYAGSRQMDDMAALTYKMHHHPLTVSNSALEVNAAIVAMHRHMKDVVLAKNDTELAQAITAVETDEAKIYKLFDIIGERYLGDQLTIQAALTSFREWKPIRQSVIDHIRNGETMLAAEITKGIGAKHVELMMVRMESLIKFARNKADEFLQQSNKERDSNKLIFIVVTGSVILMWAGISYFVIARIRTTETHLNFARQEAEQANKAKSQFLANMSHDLRTPLNAIMGFSDLMLNKIHGPLGNPQYVTYAQDIRRSGGFLVSMVNDILDLSKIEAGRYTISDTHINVADLFTNLHNLLITQSQRAQVDLDFEIGEGVRVLIADTRAITQVMTNLLANSVKFTAPGGWIKYRADLDDQNRIYFQVSDSGRGMSQEQIDIAFEPFRHTDPKIACEENGTGLGLYLCDRLLSLHEATIDIQSQVGVGTVITMVFPPQRCGALHLISAQA